MRLIENNPFRVLGLLVGASAKEQERQTRRLRQFIEAEQEPDLDFSFPILGEPVRTIQSVNEAASKLNLDSDKMHAALFWFYNGNDITDEPAFDAIKEGETDLAIEIWRKLAYDLENDEYNEVTKRNASAFHNLSTLYLQLYGVDQDTLQFKLLFLESDFFKELKTKATDDTYKTSKKDLQLLFLNSLLQEESVDESEFAKAILDIDFLAKEDFLKGYIQKPIDQIEKRIEEAKSMRKANKADSIKAANKLAKETSEQISQIKSILGASHVKYGSIADKLAMEFFACGRDYFMLFRDTSLDPGEISMKLFEKAKSIAVGTIAKQQINENINDLQEWIDDKPEREINKKIGNDVKSIIEKINLAAETLKNKGKYPKGYNDPYSDLPFEEQPHNLELRRSGSTLDTQPGKQMDLLFQSHLDSLFPKEKKNEFNINLFRLARDTVKNCKTHLDKIKIAVGASNEIYQKLSNDVATISLACLIDYVNNNGNPALNIRPSVGESEINVMDSIGELDMNPDFRKRYLDQKNALNRLAPSSVRNHSASQPSSGSKNWADDNPGCLIAILIGVIILLIAIFSN
jgi:hypothetical protein